MKKWKKRETFNVITVSGLKKGNYKNFASRVAKLTNKNTGCPMKFEYLISCESLLISNMHYLRHNHTKNASVVYLEFKLNLVSFILSGYSVKTTPFGERSLFFRK